MKKIIVMLFMCCTLLSAQEKPRISEGVKTILVFSTSILLNATGDALKDSGHKVWGHTANAASIATLLSSKFYMDYSREDWLTYMLSYMCFRISLFDPIYNSVRGLPITYIGNTSLWDKGLQKLAPPEGFMLGRGISLIVGISLPLNNLNYPKARRYNRNHTFPRS